MMPLVVSGRQTGATRLPFAITDKERSKNGAGRSGTARSIPSCRATRSSCCHSRETELLGRFRFKQRCALCHAAQTNSRRSRGDRCSPSATSTGREATVRRQILEGRRGCLPSSTHSTRRRIDAIIAYL